MAVTGRLLIGVTFICNVALSQVTGQGANPAAGAKVRVLITESDSWAQDSGPPATDEVMKTLSEKCPELTVTLDYTNVADYIVRLDHKGALPKLVVLGGEGGTIFSSSKVALADALKSVCTAIQRAIKPVKKNPELLRPPSPTDQWPGAARSKKQ